MNIIDEKKLKNSDPKDTYIKLIITPDCLSRFPMQIMYYKERGFTNFILAYLNENSKYNFEKLAIRILPNIHDTIEKENVNIGLSGFPRCVFDQYFLKDELKYKFENKFFYHKDCEECEEEYEKTLDCIDCKLNDSCSGMYKKHLKKYKEEILPIYNHCDLKCYYEKMLEYLSNETIKEKFEICLNDYINDENINHKKLFTKERISSGSDEIKEGFSYQIINCENQIENNIQFLSDITNQNLDEIKQYLMESGFITISFELTSDDKIKYRLEFDTSKIEVEKLENLFDKCNFTKPEEIKKIDSIKIQINDDNTSEIIELGTNYETLSSEQVKDIFKTYELQQKRMLLKFLNSMHKDIKNCKVKYGFEHSIQISTRFETTLKENTLKLRLLFVLFDARLIHLLEKKILNLWFEVFEFQNEKYGFNHMPKLPKRMPEFEEKRY